MKRVYLFIGQRNITMATNDVQGTLDRILQELKSNDSERCLSALQELNNLNFSSPAILRELERLAIYPPDEEVRNSARQSLNTSVHQFIRSNMNKLNRGERAFLLKQIEQWEEDGLLESNLANVIKQRYNFDISTPAVMGKITPEIDKEPSLPSALQQSAVPAGPRPSLMQTLLSESSIRIYLYLGAFFVIASALILAAFVQAARLPILAVATLTSGGGALVIHRRLPQPSFALFIVFSFLLPIDANVLKETIGFTEPSLSIYWTLIFLMMTIIWEFSIWFYESRFFSVVAFVSLSLVFYRAGEIFHTEIELQIFLGMLASLVGLAGTFVLRKWKDNKFSVFIFLFAQLQVLGLLLTSLAFATIHTFDSGISNPWWLLITLTWLAAASFYVLSDILIPTFVFPWMAAAALLPLPWFFLNIFNGTQPMFVLGFWTWGTVFAVVSEVAFRLFEKIKKYYWALLASSALLFLTSFSIALVWDRSVLTFVIFALTALVYTAIHLIRPRWYIWCAALLGALSAYFTFFFLPIIEKLEFPFVYQLLIASSLLVLPELFTRSPLSLKSETRWPAITSGIIASFFGIALALADLDHTGRGALVLIIYAVLFTLHALHGKREWLGYFATATEPLAIIYTLNHFNLDLWLPVLTALAVLYYATGFFFRRSDGIKAWGNVLINSGLTLGVLISLTSLALFKETSGWYIIVITLLFGIEIFSRPLAWLELIVEILLSISLYLILDDLNITQASHFLFGASLIWLGGDLIFARLVREKRRYRPITLAAGYVLVFITTVILWRQSDSIVVLQRQLKAIFPITYYTVYVVFFAFYALLQHKPQLGYLATAFLSLAVIKFGDAINFEKWTFFVIALAVLYYALGYWLRRTQKASGWEQMLLYSG